jgi:hypothetical protein
VGTAGKKLTKVGREAPGYLLRLPQELKEELQKEANLNGRSMNSEILSRLQMSMEQQARLLKQGYRVEDAARSELAALSDLERAFLAVARGLSPEKQLALISLFK